MRFPAKCRQAQTLQLLETAAISFPESSFPLDKGNEDSGNEIETAVFLDANRACALFTIQAPTVYSPHKSKLSEEHNASCVSLVAVFQKSNTVAHSCERL